MKTLVWSPLAIRSCRPHVLLAVAQQAIDAGEEVVFVSCDGTLPACVSNLHHARVVCRHCTARQKRGLSLLSGRFVRRGLSDYVPAERASAIARSADGFTDLAALRALRYRGADVGQAALSCFVTATREPDPDLRVPAVRRALQQLVNAGKLAFEAIAAAAEREQPDRVVLFNGRHSSDRSVVRFCQGAGIACDVYEVTQKHDHVLRLRDAMFGDIAPIVAQIEATWAQGGDDRVAVAAEYFARARRGARTFEPVYTGAQRQGELPDGWDAGRRNLVVFASSEDEFVAINEEWDERVYPTQAEAVARICAGLAADPGTHVWLRLHPHTKDLDRSYARALLALDGRFANLTVIPAASSACSYALLDGASAVVTFGSTVGLEAVYWGRPSVLLANCFHRGLGGTYDPRSHDEVLALLRRDLPPLDPTAALKIAFFRMRAGERLANYDADRRKGPRHGYTFRGDRLVVHGPTRWLARWYGAWNRSTNVQR